MISGTPQNRRRIAVELSVRESQIRTEAARRVIADRVAHKQWTILSAAERAQVLNKLGLEA